MTQRSSASKRRAKGTGTMRQLPSGRWQAAFRGHPAGITFDTKLDAGAWLRAQTRAVDRGSWAPPTAPLRNGSVGEYAETWLKGRDLKPRTAALYRGLLDRLILPGLGDVALDDLTPAAVRHWHAGLDASRPTQRAHAYALLRTILGTAVADDLVAANPCRIRGAGSSRTVHRTKTATLPELDAIVTAMPERLQCMVLLAAWTGLRFGELTELRRRDVIEGGVRLTVARGVVRVDGTVLVGDPKSRAGVRSVAVPPHVRPALAKHLERHVAASADALLFPAVNGGHLAPSSLYRPFYAARTAAGRPDLRWHDLRHTGATLAAATGATLAELMARMGHSTPAAALRYQHAAADRDAAIAEAMSGLLER